MKFLISILIFVSSFAFADQDPPAAQVMTSQFETSSDINVEIEPFVPVLNLQNTCATIRPQEYTECKVAVVRAAYTARCTRYKITRGLTRLLASPKIKRFRNEFSADDCFIPQGYESGEFVVSRQLIRHPANLVVTNVPKEVCFAQPLESRTHPLPTGRDYTIGQVVRVRNPFPRRVCRLSDPGVTDPAPESAQ